MKKIAILFVFVLTVTLFSCESGSSSDKSYKATNPYLREVVVKEVLQTSSYTYLKLKEEEAVYWAAITRKDDIKPGDTYYYDNFMEMKNFPSKELDRTFDNIYFIDRFEDKPFASDKALNEKKKGSPKVGDMEVEKIAPVEGSVSIADLYDNKADYAGKKVKVHGKVVKFTSAVMNKNWIHIQDGTNSGDNFDLTVTTPAFLNNGDIATFEGTVALDKDFGYGYAYDILVEDAELLNVEKSTKLQ
jgi:hypothetical protein